MAWIWALRHVPWRTILTHAPTIVDAARSYYSTTRRTTDERGPDHRARRSIDDLRLALERLEEREVEQAALFADAARQLQDLSTAVEALRVRLLLALWGAGAALVVALTALIVALRG